MKSNEQRRVFVVENQHYQFDEIRTLLEKKYLVSPGIGKRGTDRYLDFIDAVRIYLNPRFRDEDDDDAKRKRALECIERIVTAKMPDLFLVDQILVGNHVGDRGSDLVENVLAQYGRPVLFVSRSDWFDPETQAAIKRLRKSGLVCDWVNKGSSGLALLHKEYFLECLEPKMIELLEEHDRRQSLVVFLQESLGSAPEPGSERMSKLAGLLTHYVGDDLILVPDLGTNGGLLELSERMLVSFEDLIKRVGFWRFLHKGPTGSGTAGYAVETVSHLLFAGVIEMYQSVYSFNASYESQINKSKVEFRVLGNLGRQVILEFKLDLNIAGVKQGMLGQFPDYLEKFNAKAGIFVLMQIEKQNDVVNELIKLWEENYKTKEGDFRFKVIDAREPTASSKIQVPGS